MNTLKTSLAAFGLLFMLGACSNPAPSGPTAECASDRDCNAADKCRVCEGGRCTSVAGCCAADSDCASGQRCWKESGTSYSKCGAK